MMSMAGRTLVLSLLAVTFWIYYFRIWNPISLFIIFRSLDIFGPKRNFNNDYSVYTPLIKFYGKEVQIISEKVCKILSNQI